MPRFFHCSRALIPAITLIVAAPVALIAYTSTAAAEASDSAVDDEGPGAGTLMLRGLKSTETLPAVRLGTNMDVTVSGSIARVRVTQVFRNTSDKWMEATYLYPLPEDGAVDSLKMVIGQRVIVGQIEKRAVARALYEKAKASGQKAGLVEQQRPNMFTNSVANIGPGETVLVSIEYQMPVKQSRGSFSLRLPLVVGPRYTPPHTLTSATAVADANAVTSAPVLNPKAGQTLNPVSITVRLAPGFRLANVISPYHRVAITGHGDERTIKLAAGTVPADRDFELDWRSASADPTLGLFREHTDYGDFVMATINPPVDQANAPTPPREMVFVIDNSGSMGGASMDEAKASLIYALKTLQPQDHFNIIRFDDTMTQLFTHSVAATPDQIALATRFAEGLKAAGGTEMLPALKAALADAASSGGPTAVRQVIFLTDGEISNEQEMLATLGEDGGRSHIFFVGIGSAPNDHLMTRMATIGRGAFTHVGSPEEVAAKITPLLDMLRHPAMQNITVKVSGGTLDLTPRDLPDLYFGQPLVLVGKTDHWSGTLTVSGTIAGKAWQRSVVLSDAKTSPSVAKLWARRRIDDIEADRTLGKLDTDKANDQIAEIGLANSLVTSQTSLVAIDRTPVRPAGEGLVREDLPLNLPAGWDFDTLFGGESGKAAMRNVDTLAARAAEQATALALPKTATGFVGAIVNGLVLLLLGIGGLFFLRRHRGAAQ
ncbi:marine proteobacterial sortase target protein [Sphingomonas paeninsulae]|uniref:Marine proteobacterial sortase target protein n=1 Tax=Sphingomonas paeninsulae TaxID=2319844 RepID=A0A494TKF4_SPHPE|nr:marine proteobacterial sortase target protein [Sphingomonas paeninsulae]AYJ88014.1 marine proteobacterial sortase target protein [Sphingomonas paeninsulae]